LLRTIPKKVFSLEEVKAGEKLYEVCVILKDVPGALAKVAKLFADANVNIKTSTSFYVPSYLEVGFWSSFIDISKAKQSIDELEKELRKLGVVVDVLFEEPKPAPFEVMHFPILHGKGRAVIMPVAVIWTLWEGLEKILQPSGLAAVHYDAGKNTGVHTAKRLKQKYDLGKTDLISSFAQAMKATGWGIIEFHEVDFRRLSGTIIIKECFEAVAWRKKPYKVCHWTRGVLAGFMSTVFEKTVEAVEVKCLATGDKHCEFKIQSQP